MKHIWKAYALIFALSFVMAQTASASDYVDVTTQCEAKVLKIVDGESLIVEITNSKKMAMVKMIGVDASGSDTALRFNEEELLGKAITISPDPFVPTPEGRWSMVYVYIDSTLFNQKTIIQGHAKANQKHSNALMYPNLSSEASSAEQSNIGVWNNAQGISNFSYASQKVNINTANTQQLTSQLNGIDYYLAERIVLFRKSSPFRTVGDIKFVSGFTKEIFDKNRNKMTVSTNIADASKEELETLGVLSELDISNIIDYRSKKRIEAPDDLIVILGDYYKYSQIKNFVDTRNVTELVLHDSVVNINTASIQQLTAAGLNQSHANMIYDAHRINSTSTTDLSKIRYSFKTLGELMYFPGIYLSFDQINALESRLRLMTNINNAPDNELLSLNKDMNISIISSITKNRPYSDKSDIRIFLTDDIYISILNYIYINQNAVPARVNVNTATLEQLTAAGFSSEQMATLLSLNKRIRYIWDIPFDFGELDANAALFTNVNKAQYNELISLNNGMTPAIANSIISYRDNQPIGSMDELRQIFYSHNAEAAYNLLQNFMVLR